MKIAARLLLSFLLVSVLPLSLFAYFSVRQSEEALRAEVLGKLASLADKKMFQVRDYLTERVLQVQFLARTPTVTKVIGMLPGWYAKSRNGTQYRAADAALHNYFSRYIEESGLFYDVFLVTPQGEVIYTYKHESDFATSLLTGPFNKTQLAQAFLNTRLTLQPVISGYEFYEPSEAPALFVSAPVMRDGKFAGVFAVQFSNELLYRVALDTTGLGASGEAVFARRDGTGLLYTTPLRYQHDAALKFFVTGMSQTIAMSPAVLGESGEGVKLDYRSVPVAAAWRYLPELDWGMVVKIDADEAFAPLVRQRYAVLGIMAGLLLLSGLAAYFFGRQISRPLQRLVKTTEEVSRGKWEARADERIPGELGHFAQAFNRMSDRLQDSYRSLEMRVAERTQELGDTNARLAREIDERERVAAVLRKNQEYLQVVLQDLNYQKFALDEHAIVSITDMQDAITYVNDKFCAISGYGREELMGQNHRLLNSGAHPKAFFRDMYQAIGAGKVWHGDICNRAKDGRHYWVETTIVPHLGNDGSPFQYIAICTDITERKNAEKMLERHKRVLDMAQDGFCLVDTQGRLLEVNQAYADISGYSVDELVGMTIPKLEATERPEETRGHIEKLIATGYDRFETRHRHKDGHETDIEVSALFMKESNQIASFLRDITERKRNERRLRIAAMAFETHEGIMITDAQANIIQANRAFEYITGYSVEEVLGKNPRILSSGRHDKAFYRDMWQQILEEGTWSGEIWDKRKNGEIYPKWLTISAVKDPHGHTTEYVAIFSDITARKQAEEEIRNLAFYDGLTGLPNRRLLHDRFQLALSLSERSHHCGALLFLDIDRFKTLNDTLGHDYGDLMLVETARRIQSCVREVDTVARLGGDEFVILLEDLGANQQEASQKIALVAEKIRTVLAQPYQLNGLEYHSSSSIGVSLYRGHGESSEMLMKQADLAMYQAKDSGRNVVRFFDPLMQQAVEEHAGLEADLRGALPNKQLQLYYQLQVDNDHRPIGAEALIRWKHPRRGMVSPGQFIPIAEESSLIFEIGNWVIETACQQLVAWQQDEIKRHLILAINVSAQQFQMRDFVKQLEQAVVKYGVNPQCLKLELTESVVLGDVADVVGKMYALKALGIRLSLDDFGTGYSSLAYLKRLPLDQIKIDQSFVRDVIADTSDAVMVQTIIDMAKNFRLNVIAEGVETEAQLEFLKLNGCMAYQGYLFGRPVPIGEFEQQLAKLPRL